MKKSWKQWMRTGCLALALAALAGCSSEEPVEAVSAVDDGTLTVGIIDGGDVFASKTEDGFTGIEPEILNSLAESLGVSIAYVEASGVQELMDLLDAGTIDVAAGRLGEVETYSQTHLLSRNYAKKGLYLVTGKNSYVDTLVGFSGETVGISPMVPGSVRLEIPYVSEVNLADYTDLSGVAADIQGGVIRALICTEREAMGLLDSGLMAKELYNGPRVEAMFYLSPGQETLTASLNSAINQYLDNQ